MSENWLLIGEAAARKALVEGVKPLCDRIAELEAEIARLRRILTEGPSSRDECKEFCRCAIQDADGRPCIDCALPA